MKITSSKHNAQVKAATEEKATAAAIKNIHAAIDLLGESAKSGNITAKESIANLSVVLLDLQSK